MSHSVRSEEKTQPSSIDETAAAASAAPPGKRSSHMPLRMVATRVAAGLVLYVILLVGLHVARDHAWLPVATNSSSADASGPLVPAARQFLGIGDPRDFYVDYASAHAMTHGKDAYDISSKLFTGLGPAWGVNSPNPHPPTLMTLLLPFTLVGYGAALSAWAIAMVAAFIATLRLVGVRLGYAVGIGVALALTFPGAYGIGNPVPIIGLGAALAYRYRDSAVVAGLGIALAAMPKGSGLILAVPFLLAARLRTVLYAAGFYVAAAVIPLAWQSNIWSRYLDSGVKSVNANSDRPDNASILRGAHALLGLSYSVTAVLVILIGIGIALAQRDLFWPTVWGTVALLPIAWMYSLLTLVPLLAFVVLAAPRRTAWLAALAAGFAIGSPPLGQWPTVTFPIALGLAGIALAVVRPPQSVLWVSGPLERLLPARLRGPAAVPAVPAAPAVSLT